LRISWSIGATTYSYLKCIVYDKLLKPRKSFRKTLYINQSINPFSSISPAKICMPLPCLLTHAAWPLHLIFPDFITWQQSLNSRNHSKPLSFHLLSQIFLSFRYFPHIASNHVYFKPLKKLIATQINKQINSDVFISFFHGTTAPNGSGPPH
jgi:hypothetical protein